MSTQQPRLEARVRAQERMQNMLHARIEELSEDMNDSFKQLADYQIQTERKIGARFDKIETNMATKEDLAAIKGDIAVVKEDLSGVKEDITLVKGELSGVKEDIAVVKGDLSGVKEDIAVVKGDMVAMEGRILDAFKQLLVMVDSRLPSSQG